MDARRRQELELLPGGRYLVCYVVGDDAGFSKNVECWEVETNQRVWVWSRPGCSVIRAGFYFPDRENEAVVYILFSESVVVMGAEEALFLKVNLETGHSEELFGLPRGRYYRPQICGDLFACCLGPTLNILLINWQATEYVILSFGLQSGTFETFKGHVIVSHRKSGSTMDHFHIYSSQDLERYWRPLSESYWANGTYPQPDASLTFTLPDGDLPTNHTMHSIDLFVAESPLKHQTYDLVVESNDFIQNRLFKRTSGRTTGWITTAFHYQLALPSHASPLQEPTLNSIFRYSTYSFPFSIGRMTTAGKYLLTDAYPLDPLGRRVDKAGLKHPFQLSLPRPKEDPPYNVRISRSTAVVAIYTSCVVILYYQ
ncbi:hypothetical protein B0H13DRAFT_2015030 [Mycena leptocephala]|nr:hypothetical protein B0H13DRAFT_2015030 [Mycena leptocephala]